MITKSHDPRHAAALALVGWYLMMPFPKTKCPDKSLNDYIHVKSYDTAKDCEKDKVDLIEQTRQPNYAVREGFKSWTVLQVRTMLQVSECIATDDPRLKEK